MDQLLVPCESFHFDSFEVLFDLLFLVLCRGRVEPDPESELACILDSLQRNVLSVTSIKRIDNVYLQSHCKEVIPSFDRNFFYCTASLVFIMQARFIWAMFLYWNDNTKDSVQADVLLDCFGHTHFDSTVYMKDLLKYKLNFFFGNHLCV